MTKLLSLLLSTIGIFILFGFASASTTTDLQPASDIVYNENLTVNGTGRFNSAYIGSTTGEGGVTFFNGTMINASEGSVPLTMGDDLRVDGMIWRGTSKGTADNMPLKIADTLMPALDNINDIGTVDMRWKNIYFADTLSGTSASFTGVTSGTGAFSDELTVADYIAVGGGYGSTGTTLDSSGNIQFDGDLTTSGNINQSISSHGAVKALVAINATNDECDRSWTYDGSEVDCNSHTSGFYIIGFNFNVSNRYWQITSTDIDHYAVAYNPTGLNNYINVQVYNKDTDTGEDATSILTIY